MLVFAQNSVGKVSIGAVQRQSLLANAVQGRIETPRVQQRDEEVRQHCQRLRRLRQLQSRVVIRRLDVFYERSSREKKVSGDEPEERRDKHY